MEIKSTPRDSCPPRWGDQSDSGYKTWQLGVTFGDLGLRHMARGEERRASACLMLLLWEISSWGKTLQILQLAEPSWHPACKRARAEAATFPGPAWPQLRWRFSWGQGESSTWRAASFSSLQLVPRTAIWKYLSSRFGAKEQLAYTLLLCYPP